MTNMLRKITRPATLAALAIGFSVAFAAQAASIKLETKVPGYTSAGWILVLPELRPVLGGKVRYDSIRKCWVTDRVSRGNEIRVTIAPSTTTERCQKGALAGVYSESNRDFFQWAAVSLPFVKTTRVTNNPATDNVYVWTCTSAGYYEKRVPIGTR